MRAKKLVMDILGTYIAGKFLSLLGRSTRRRTSLAGLTNPFFVSHYIVERGEARYWVPPESYLVAKATPKTLVAFKSGYEPEVSYLISALIHKTDTILDIGANIGLHTVAFAQKADSGSVIAFEPVPHLAEHLSVNCALNGLKNVTIAAYGLGNSNDSKDMFVHSQGDGLEGTSSFLGTDHVTNGFGKYDIKTLPIRRLDDVYSELNIKSRISFMKIDTEGFEPLVIEGARETIDKHRPAMLIEAHSARLRKLGKSFMWYQRTFPNYHIFMVPETTYANPTLQLIPLKDEPKECCVNLLLLPKTSRI